tara:strand:+ start:55 stop:378 length:324 start_codon:yes stop_codon:yes gene_type:complete
MKKILLLIFMINLLNACQSVTEGFTLKKNNNADEFLVEKKNPLVLPPNFNELPTPNNTQISNEESKNEQFDSEFLTKNQSKDKNAKITKSKSTEEFILKNIKKNDSN